MWTPTGVVLALTSLAFGCAKPPTDEECRAAIKRTIELPVDGLNDPSGAAAAVMAEVPAEQRQRTAELLKAHATDIIKPEAVKRCMDHLKKADIQCTLAATSSEELVKNCHWKAAQGPRGPVVGF